MDIKKLNIEELEKLSQLDIAYNLLKFNKKTYTTAELLKEICEVLGLGEKEYQDLIGDFYTSLNLDKRFILIENKWDLTENHSVKVIIEDDLDDDLEDYEEIDDNDDEDEDSTTEDDIVSDDTEALEDVEDDIDDEIEDLSIIEEEEPEEEI